MPKLELNMRYLKNIIAITILSALGLSTPSMAGWISASGSAGISNDDIKQAREEAIEDALYNIMMQVGADVKVEQSMVNGVITNQRIDVNSKSSIKNVTVLEEQKTENAVNVRVRAYVDESLVQSCKQSRVRKTVLPVLFRYSDNNAYQSAVGIEDLNEQVSNMLYRNLASSKILAIKPTSNARLYQSTGVSSFTSAQEENIEALATAANSQYVILGNITSASVSSSGNNPVTEFLYTKTRNISFDVSVYDTLSNTIIFNHRYTGEAQWPFKQGDYVDLRSEKFLASDYGSRVKQLIKYASQDILTTLQCLTTQAKVVQVEGDKIVVDLGMNSNVKVGDVFTLSHKAPLYDRQSKIYERTINTHSQYVVVSVNEQTSLLKPVDLSKSLIDISLDDIVLLQ